MTKDPNTGKFQKDLPPEMLQAAIALTDTDGRKAEDSIDTLLKRRLLESLDKQLAKQQAEEEQKLEEVNRALKMRTEQAAHEKERRELGQAICPHRKENGRPNIGGQRLSNGHTVFICGTCYKTWDETNLPPTLQVQLENIGG